MIRALIDDIKLYRETLAFVNAIRKGEGLPRRWFLRRGVPAYPYSCPITNSVGIAYGATGYSGEYSVKGSSISRATISSGKFVAAIDARDSKKHPLLSLLRTDKINENEKEN